MADTLYGVIVRNERGNSRTSIGYGSLSALNKRHHLIMTYLLAPTPIHYIELLPNTKSLYPKGASQINPGRHMKQLPKRWPINGSPVSYPPIHPSI